MHILNTFSHATCYLTRVGVVNLIFFPFKGCHFRKCLNNHFKGSAWLKLTLDPNHPEDHEWGRVWINPTFTLEDMESFFGVRGFTINALNKDALLAK